MSGRAQRRIVRLPRYELELQHIRETMPRAEEAIEGLELVIARIPDQGMAVPGQPSWCARPAHTPDGSFLVVYSYTEDEVVCRGIRRVPSGPY